MIFTTKKDAVAAWVREFNAIPTEVVIKLWEASGYEDFREVTDRIDEDAEPFPMWGTMWQFGDSIDEDWLDGQSGEDGIQIMSDLGFRIYESEDFGHVFGIDGAGYDFYEQHWIPLYEARGLHWHNEA